MERFLLPPSVSYYRLDPRGGTVVTAHGRRRRLVLGSGVCVIGLILAGCGAGDRTGTPTPTTPPEPTATAVAAISTLDTSASAVAQPPTPDAEGVYRDLTVEQARAIVPFGLVFPANLPDPLAQEGIQVIESPPVRTGGRVYQVTAYYEAGASGDTYQYLQSNQTPSDGSVSDATPTEIAGTSVSTTTLTRPDGSAIVTWEWTDGEIFRQVVASVKDDNTEALAEILVSSILVSDTTGQRDATRSLPSAHVAIAGFGR